MVKKYPRISIEVFDNAINAIVNQVSKQTGQDVEKLKQVVVETLNDKQNILVPKKSIYRKGSRKRKDPNAPKNHHSSWALFQEEQRKIHADKGTGSVSMKQLSKEYHELKEKAKTSKKAKERWNALEDRAKKLKAEYEKAKAEYEGKDVGNKPKGNVRGPSAYQVFMSLSKGKGKSKEELHNEWKIMNDEDKEEYVKLSNNKKKKLGIEPVQKKNNTKKIKKDNQDNQEQEEDKQVEQEQQHQDEEDDEIISNDDVKVDDNEEMYSE
jgi:hypothetical protein